MSIGGPGLDVEYTSRTPEKRTVANKGTAIRKSSIRDSIVPVEKVTAYINPTKGLSLNNKCFAEGDEGASKHK